MITIFHTFGFLNPEPKVDEWSYHYCSFICSNIMHFLEFRYVGFFIYLTLHKSHKCHPKSHELFPSIWSHLFCILDSTSILIEVFLGTTKGKIMCNLRLGYVQSNDSSDQFLDRCPSFLSCPFLNLEFKKYKNHF